jgi:Ser/Thr protein kinase RdoA (MazF antagonist)
MESLGENPTAIPALLRAMAELHARLHQVPAAAAPGAAAPPPLAELDRALAATADAGAGPGAAADAVAGAGAVARTGAGAERFAAERAWLHENAPPAGPPVVCHGDVQPSSVRLDGGDVASAQLVDWSHARVGEAEYDVALTLLMFWSAPYLAEGIGQRKMLKTVRDMITDGYRSAYESSPGSGPLDDRRLRYWGAFHALAWSVRLAAAEAAGGPADPWDPVALVQHVGSYRKDLGRRFARLTRG